MPLPCCSGSTTHQLRPALRDQTFNLPANVQKSLTQYESEFARRKRKRRLEWLVGLGTATVDLQLEDRSVSLECATWQAAVIHEFSSSTASPVQRSVDDLASALEMEPIFGEVA